MNQNFQIIQEPQDINNPKNPTQISPSGNTVYEASPVIAQTSAQQTLIPLFTAESGITYPERPIQEKKERVTLDLTDLPIEVAIERIDELPNEQFAMARRLGFGGSDSGALCQISPYKSIEELIVEKTRKELTAEEIATGKEVAVMKGHDLEPLVLYKFQRIFDMPVLKPSDMYQYTEHPYLTMNFDGVTGSPEQYLPIEVKIVTARGERHYNPFTAIYAEGEGFMPLPQNHAVTNNTIVTKAEMYGIPPYYYTQLQDQIMALNAPFGFLATLWERNWTLRVYLVHPDLAVHNLLKINGYKAWQKVETIRNSNGYYK